MAGKGSVACLDRAEVSPRKTHSITARSSSLGRVPAMSKSPESASKKRSAAAAGLDSKMCSPGESFLAPARRSYLSHPIYPDDKHACFPFLGERLA